MVKPFARAFSRINEAATSTTRDVLSKSNILILTATVTPPAGAAQLARTDADIRLNDYKLALEFYISRLKSNAISHIVFADNSNSDIHVLKELAAANGVESRIEFLSFDGLDHPPEYGRGYGEFKLLDYAMKHSRVISQAKATARIWKITGRYILKNFDQMLNSAPRTMNLYCNYRNYPGYWIDLFVMCWNKGSYAKLLHGMYKNLREDIGQKSAEILFREKLEAAPATTKIHRRFRRTPLLSGRRGLDNKEYADMKLKIWMRRISVRLTPWLWI